MNGIKLKKKKWKNFLGSQFSEPYFISMWNQIEKERLNKDIYPSEDLVFAAFNCCKFDQTKVILIGQDPYHGPGQAHGLSFSVPKGVKVPPSLRNIYKELNSDLNVPVAEHGDLSSWANQGVLLLNASLTVKDGEPGSHSKLGWELFTDRVIQILYHQKNDLVFILWGNFAKKKGSIIDRSKHFVIESAHPSPLSARHGFFGSKPFSKANNYLISKGMEPINWQIS